MRVAVLLSMMLLLGGCTNRVVSDTPWFTKEAEANAPHLRPGVWVSMKPPAETGKKDCRFDEHKPIETWPDCVSGYVVREGEYLTLGGIETTAHGRIVRDYDWDSATHVLAAGNPRIDQVEGCPGLLKEHSNAEAADQATVDGAPPAGKAEPPRAKAEPPRDAEPTDPDRYCYDAVRSTKVDAGGRITAVLTWPVLCGPWPTKEKVDRSRGNVTDAPFPGLHVVKNDCTAESEKALREAAKASEAVAASIHYGPVEAHWVREGYR